MTRSALRLGVSFLILIGVGGITYAVYTVGVILGFLQPFQRPPAVSPSARFVHVWESAAWFDCTVDLTRDVNVCRVWDSAGLLRASGNFRLYGMNRAARREELRPSMLGPSNNDGSSDTIYLFGPHRNVMGPMLERISQ